MARDSTVRKTLLGDGWRMATVWECALRKPERVDSAASLLAEWLRGRTAEIEIGNAE